jgi:DNA-binding NarL/FixJ family response regulator
MGITATAGLASVTAAAANAAPSTANTQSAQSPPPKANSGGDTVQLTVAQQVYQLYNQGQKVSEIASALSLSVAAVNSYLNLSGSGS